MIKAVLFDLDNTLIDFMRFKNKCCEAAIEEMISAGLRMDKAKASSLLFKIYNKYGIEHKMIFQKFLKKAIGEIDYKILAYGIMAYRKMKNSYLEPYPGVISTLIKLKKDYKLAIISDAPKLKAWERLATMRLDEFFDVVITAADVKAEKPSSRIFKKTLEKLNVKPEEAVMIGDRVARDIKGARSMGIKSVFAKYGDLKIKKSGADFEINDIRELPGVLDKLKNK